MTLATPVLEIMSKELVTVRRDATIREAAALMKQRDVGSLLVVADDAPSGIITEKDLVNKVVAEDRKPSDLRVEDIMSSPVLTVTPYQEVMEAARIMADRGIRRLAVVENDDVVGLITEKDILRIWPAMIEVARQRAEMAPAATAGTAIGYCESCRMFSDRLTLHNGQLVCPECLEGLES